VVPVAPPAPAGAPEVVPLHIAAAE
jgi:hypothetical protein